MLVDNRDNVSFEHRISSVGGTDFLSDRSTYLSNHSHLVSGSVVLPSLFAVSVSKFYPHNCPEVKCLDYSVMMNRHDSTRMGDEDGSFEANVSSLIDLEGNIRHPLLTEQWSALFGLRDIVVMLVGFRETLLSMRSMDGIYTSSLCDDADEISTMATHSSFDHSHSHGNGHGATDIHSHQRYHREGVVPRFHPSTPMTTSSRIAFLQEVSPNGQASMFCYDEIGMQSIPHSNVSPGDVFGMDTGGVGTCGAAMDTTSEDTEGERLRTLATSQQQHQSFFFNQSDDGFATATGESHSHSAAAIHYTYGVNLSTNMASIRGMRGISSNMSMNDNASTHIQRRFVHELNGMQYGDASNQHLQQLLMSSMEQNDIIGDGVPFSLDMDFETDIGSGSGGGGGGSGSGGGGGCGGGGGGSSGGGVDVTYDVATLPRISSRSRLFGFDDTNVNTNVYVNAASASVNVNATIVMEVSQMNR